MPRHLELHDVPVAKAAVIVLEIVQQEGPISRDEVARRFTSLFRKEGTGTRITQAADAALRQLMDNSFPILLEERFWVAPKQRDMTPMRSRTDAPLSLQKAEAISPRDRGGHCNRRSRKREAVEAGSADRGLARLRLPEGGTGLQGCRTGAAPRFITIRICCLQEMTGNVAGKSQPLARKDRIHGYYCRKQ